ncbi:MAG TPA: hypothetical protein DCR35_01615 [Runella sp.]|nr:hypothetical protein [Runella sp.]
MQKIDKTLILSSEYKQWEESMRETHSPYNSSNNKYYYDVVMNLLHCQKGVCAYTEMSLCDEKYYKEECWKDGKYIISKPEFMGALDHFNPALKKNTGWLWDNFFIVQKDINDKAKRNKSVDDILKPDSPLYDPFSLLEYDEKAHVFIANADLEEYLQKRINDMIDILGINYSPIPKLRKKHLQRIIEKIKNGIGNWEEEQAANEQYFTAFEMCRQKLA